MKTIHAFTSSGPNPPFVNVSARVDSSDVALTVRTAGANNGSVIVLTREQLGNLAADINKFLGVRSTKVRMSFDDLVDHGRANGGNIVNGMPWSFTINGCPVSHENDQCYSIMRSTAGTVHMRPGDTLIVLGMPSGHATLIKGDANAG